MARSCFVLAESTIVTFLLISDPVLFLLWLILKMFLDSYIKKSQISDIILYHIATT